MANTYVAYAGDGSTNTWTVPFAYLDETHVHVYIDGVEDTTFTWVTDSSVAATSVPGSGAVVLVKRETPRDALVTVIPVSGTLRGTDINNQSLQALYAVEEGFDALIGTIGLSSDGLGWDATNLPLENLADPTNAQDAATKSWVDSTYSTAVANASASATSAANSASAASTSASDAAASASAASASETAAAASETAAAASETAAAASETAAAASETAAASSASSASTSASTATTQAGIATTQATNASNSASAASTSATNAAASETAAAASASSASGSASTATTQAGIATTQATNASNSASAAATSASNASTSETNAAASASAASTSASNAATSETNAASSASSASTSATNASTSASNAATSASNAATSEANAATSYDNFDDRFLGPKASDPTLDNDGNALLTGAIYWNTTTNRMKFYTGTVWDDPVTAAATSETNAASSASAASTSASNAATSASNAATSETNASNSASAASTSASNAATSETNAANSASAASTSASNAATSATNASNSASAAATSASNAATSETNAAATYDLFDDRMLGAKASDPTLDNDGNALVTGTIYWNTTSSKLRIYNGSTWEDAAVPASGAVVASGTPLDNQVGVWTNATTIEGTSGLTYDGSTFGVTGNISVSGTVDGRDIATDGSKLDGIEAGATADQSAAEIEAIVNHDNLLGYVANQHINWTSTTSSLSTSGNVTSTGNFVSSKDRTTSPILMRLINTTPSGEFRFNYKYTGGANQIGFADSADAWMFYVQYGATNTHSYNFPGTGDATFGGNIVVGGTVDGRDLATDGSKLDGIEALADVTDATNVAAAGAIMDSDIAPASGILKKTGAGAYTAITDNSANWDTAYGWGDHAGLYSLTSHNHTLDSLSNVTITTIASGELLKWNGTAWINNTLAEAGIAAASHTHAWSDITSGTPTTLAGYGITDAASSSHNHTLDSLSNVTITANSAGELLSWNGSAWINQTIAELGISAGCAVSATPPGSPNNGDLWYDTDSGGTYVYVNDGTSSQWVESFSVSQLPVTVYQSGGTDVAVADGGTGASTAAGAKTNLDIGPQFPGTGVAMSGTAVSFTGIPSWVKEITITVWAFTTSGTNHVGIQIGDSSGLQTTAGNYTGCELRADATQTAHNDMWYFCTSPASNTWSAVITLHKYADGNAAWFMTSMCACTSTTGSRRAEGQTVTPGDGYITQLRLITAGGSDTFTGGYVNIKYK